MDPPLLSSLFFSYEQSSYEATKLLLSMGRSHAHTLASLNIQALNPLKQKEEKINLRPLALRTLLGLVVTWNLSGKNYFLCANNEGQTQRATCPLTGVIYVNDLNAGRVGIVLRATYTPNTSMHFYDWERAYFLRQRALKQGRTKGKTTLQRLNNFPITIHITSSQKATL